MFVVIVIVVDGRDGPWTPHEAIGFGPSMMNTLLTTRAGAH